ncbi:hypothetical protein E2C01_024560 [Portunus trituberculatus]|uniref:Uncharacterized protein n=1 Tax=Portunus trituberculatus TaxID=210409 RepID=A0A5B7ED18_PORTR|nr:hypothetical protein [Portunus trituberculatus]
MSALQAPVAHTSLQVLSREPSRSDLAQARDHLASNAIIFRKALAGEIRNIGQVMAAVLKLYGADLNFQDCVASFFMRTRHLPLPISVTVMEDTPDSVTRRRRCGPGPSGTVRPPDASRRAALVCGPPLDAGH